MKSKPALPTEIIRQPDGEEHLMVQKARLEVTGSTDRGQKTTFALLEHATATDITVLIEGESRTGKDLAAHSIHDISQRADGGTLFFNKIGALDLNLQPRLLRFLEDRQVRPSGGSNSHPVDLRIIAATNRHLADLVSSGGFRQDLFFRLAVIRLEKPLLRQRPEDIPMLTLEFARQLRSEVDQTHLVSQAVGLDRYRGSNWRCSGNHHDLNDRRPSTRFGGHPSR